MTIARIADYVRTRCAACRSPMPGVKRKTAPKRYCSHKCGCKGQPDRVINTVGTP